MPDYLMPVLDTAALLHWPIEKMQGNLVAHSQLEELRRLPPERAMLLESIEMEWMTVGTGDAELAAISTGDLQRLSNVDLEILAIAFSTGHKLYTDDYSMQNVLSFRQRWSLESQLSYFGSFSIFQLNCHYFL